MRITVIIGNKKQKVKLEKPMQVLELAKLLGLVLPEYLVKINGEFSPDTEKLKDGDVVEFIPISSSG